MADRGVHINWGATGTADAVAEARRACRPADGLFNTSAGPAAAIAAEASVATRSSGKAGTPGRPAEEAQGGWWRGRRSLALCLADTCHPRSGHRRRVEGQRRLRARDVRAERHGARRRGQCERQELCACSISISTSAAGGTSTLRASPRRPMSWCLAPATGRRPTRVLCAPRRCSTATSTATTGKTCSASSRSMPATSACRSA